MKLSASTCSLFIKISSFTSVFGNNGVSIEQFIQKRKNDDLAEIVVITEEVLEKNFDDSVNVDRIETLRRLKQIRLQYLTNSNVNIFRDIKNKNMLKYIVDGRPIYMRILHIDPLSSAPSDAITYGNYKNQTPFADKIISAEPVWYTTSSTQNVFTGNVIQAFVPVVGSYSSAISRINEILMKVAWTQVWQTKSEFAITVTRGQDMYRYACDVFVKYVKSA